MLQLKKRRKVQSLTDFERNRPKEGLDFDETTDESILSDAEQQTSSDEEVFPEIASFSESPPATILSSTDVIDALAAAEEQEERKEASNKRNAPHLDRLEEKIASTSHQTSTTDPKPASSHQPQAATTSGLAGIDRNSKRVKLAQALVANLEYRNKEVDPNKVAACIEEKCWTSCCGSKTKYLQKLANSLIKLKWGGVV